MPDNNDKLEYEIMNHLQKAAQKIIKLKGGCSNNISENDYKKANELLQQSQLATSGINGGKYCGCKECQAKLRKLKKSKK